VNLGTVSLILGSFAALFTILAYLYKGVRFNKSRSQAQQGRIGALFDVAKFQSLRLTKVETYIAKEDGQNYSINEELIRLEAEAMEEFKKNDTRLT
jgi:hypothetical protein